LILRKIVKIVATRCDILRLKGTKFDFSWDSAPDPTGGAYSTPPEPLTGFKGFYLEGRGREGINIPHGRLESLAALMWVTSHFR